MIRVSDEVTIDGVSPIVILGPNGSGKTRFAAQLANENNAEFINALRNIQLNDQLPSQSLVQSQHELVNQINSRRNNYWELANEIHILFTKLLAEDAASAIGFRDAFLPGTTNLPDKTLLTEVRDLWADVFPGRKVAFADGAPKVTSEYASSGASATYAASRMSDGERVALFLAGRVLNVSTSIIVVDEPEVHFHSRLAVRFWDALERARPNLQFVYVTHDLAFALSRCRARFVLVRPNQQPQVLQLDEALPHDIARSVLGAASFSVYAERIIFCEGTESGPDFKLLSAWADDRRTAVIPVGSCSEVMRCCQVFNESSLVVGVKAEGVIDRDYWSDAFLGQLPSGITALPVHEVESIYCRPGVVTAVANHLGINPATALSTFEATARAKCSEANNVNKQALERTKVQIEPALVGLIAATRAHSDANVVRTGLSTIRDSTKWPIDPVVVFDAEVARLGTATSTGALEEVLMYFPGKPLLPLATAALGLSGAALQDLVHSALREKQGTLVTLGSILAAECAAFLPPRRAV